MRAAGVDYARSRVSSYDLESDLRRVLDESGGTYFTQEFYVQAGGRYSTTTLKKRLHCANWAELLEKVLLVRPVRRVIVERARASRPSMEDLAGEFQRVWGEFGRRPTYDEFRSRSQIGITAFEAEFGSWTGAVVALSAQNRSIAPWGKRTHCTPELLLSELCATASKSGNKPFSYVNYRALGGCYSIGTFQNHFGSWRDALSQIGVGDGRSQPRPGLRTFTNEDFFGEMQRVWEILGRQPKAREMKQCGSRMSPQAFQVRFGSWMRAVHGFCEDRAGTDDHSGGSPAVGTCEVVSALQPPPSVAHEPRREQVAAGVLVIQKTTPRAPSLRLRFKVFQRDRFTCRACGRSPATRTVSYSTRTISSLIAVQARRPSTTYRLSAHNAILASRTSSRILVAPQPDVHRECRFRMLGRECEFGRAMDASRSGTREYPIHLTWQAHSARPDQCKMEM